MDDRSNLRRLRYAERKEKAEREEKTERTEETAKEKRYGFLNIYYGGYLWLFQ